jgi:8-oxo-dGTP pyrophosphatase MutT (NUDIX family)
MSGALSPWLVHKSTLLLERRWLKLREDRVSLAGRQEAFDFHVMEMPEWVAVVALTVDEKILFVEQYRHGCGGVSRELPAGVIEVGEPPIAAAERELLEETGYAAAVIRPLIELLPEPNRCTTKAHFFFARGAHKVGDQKPDTTEQIHVVSVDARNVSAEILSGRIQHGVHVAALLLASQLGLLPSVIEDTSNP